MPKPLHLTFVVTRANDVGGAQVHVRDLALALKLRGHCVSVISGPPGPLSHSLLEHGIEYRCAPDLQRAIQPVKDVRAFLQIRQILSELQPDLVSTHSSKAGVLGRLAARSLRLPVLFTAHGWSFGRGRPWPQRWLYQLLERAMAPAGSGLIAVSNADRDLAIRTHVGRREHSVTIHNGMPEIGPELVADAGRNPPALVMVARFAPPKDHAFVLHALSALIDRAWRVSFVGDGPELEESESLAQELGLWDRVSFLGYRRDVAEILSRHQAFLLASRFEGFPRSILEAMRAGLPVLSTDVGGVLEAVEDGVTGFVVPVGDLATFTDRLGRLIEDPDLRLRMGARARDRYQDLFRLERMVDANLLVYHHAVEGQPIGSMHPRRP